LDIENYTCHPHSNIVRLQFHYIAVFITRNNHYISCNNDRINIVHNNQFTYDKIEIEQKSLNREISGLDSLSYIFRWIFSNNMKGKTENCSLYPSDDNRYSEFRINSWYLIHFYVFFNNYAIILRQFYLFDFGKT
jgi:hypothetical protein